MPHFLFVVEVPPVPENSHGLYMSPGFSKFASEAAPKIKSVKGTIQLQTNVWLFPADNALPLLVELSALASSCSLSYSALLISGDVTPMTLVEK